MYHSMGCDGKLYKIILGPTNDLGLGQLVKIIEISKH